MNPGFSYDKIIAIIDNQELPLPRIKRLYPEHYIKFLSKMTNIDEKEVLDKFNELCENIKYSKEKALDIVVNDINYENSISNQCTAKIKDNKALENYANYIYDCISYNVILEPFISAQSGITYEYNSILECHQDSYGFMIKEPLTNNLIKKDDLIPNLTFRNIIYDFACERLMPDIISRNFRCPLTGDYIINPVVFLDGKTYEQEALELVLELLHKDIPRIFSNETILYVKNLAVRGMLNYFLKENPSFDNEFKYRSKNNKDLSLLFKQQLITNTIYNDCILLFNTIDGDSSAPDVYQESLLKLKNSLEQLKQQTPHIMHICYLLLKNQCLLIQNKFNDKFLAVVYENDMKSVKTFLEIGVDINAKDQEDITALIWAVRREHIELIKLFLKCDGLDVNAKDRYEMSALMWATANGNTKLVELLLTHKNIDVNTRNKFGDTPLIVASRGKYIDIIKLLLKDKRLDINAKNAENITALDFAETLSLYNFVNFLEDHSDMYNIKCDIF